MARPRQFDPDQALHQAMDVFWLKGYEATSVQDLVEAMGINRFSLYNTFGDKRALYLSALKKYRREVMESKLALLRSSDDPLAAIRAHFWAHVDYLCGSGAETGCLMANCCAERASHDEQVGDSVRLGLSLVESAFLGALERAHQAGQLPSGQSPGDLARYFVSCLNGLSVVAKSRPERDFLESTTRVILSVLGP